MSDRFVVEWDRKLIGVAVRVAGGFRFFSSDPNFLRLEGKVFRRVKSLLRRVRQLRPAAQPVRPAFGQ